MLRALLLGILAVTAATSCDRGGAAPAVQPGAIAGKVVEVDGEVTATRDGARRPLVAGAEVSGDDLIETGAHGHAVIVLAHNNARWELGANKQQRVASSLAWGLPRQEGPAAAGSEHTAAAGRHGERSAASAATTASADMAAAPEEEKAKAASDEDTGAPQTPVAPPPPSSDPVASSEVPARQTPPPRGALGKLGTKVGGGAGASVGGGSRDGFGRAKEEAARVTPGGGGGGDGPRDVLRLEGAETDAKAKDAAKNAKPTTPKLAPPDPAAEARQALARERAAMRACLDEGTASLDVELVVEDGIATFAIPGASAQVRACFAKIARRIELTSTTTLRVKSTVKK